MARPDEIEPGVVSSTIGISARPELVGDRPCTTSKYSGMKIIRPVCAPSAQVLVAVPQRTTWFFRISSGRNGSAAAISRQEKASQNAPDSDIRKKMVGDSHP